MFSLATGLASFSTRYTVVAINSHIVGNSYTKLLSCLFFNKHNIHRLRIQCFGSGFFFPDPDRNFFLSPDPDRPKILIRSGKIRIWIREKNVTKHESRKKCYISYLALLILSFLVRLLQNHHLDPISLLIDRSGHLKPGSGPAKKPGSIRIRIRNTANQ